MRMLLLLRLGGGDGAVWDMLFCLDFCGNASIGCCLRMCKVKPTVAAQRVYQEYSFLFVNRRWKMGCSIGICGVFCRLAFCMFGHSWKSYHYVLCFHHIPSAYFQLPRAPCCAECADIQRRLQLSFCCGTMPCCFCQQLLLLELRG